MNRIKDLRKQMGLKQSELAEKINLTASAVSGWEVGRNEPDFETLRKMSEIFGVSIDYILGGEDKAPTAYDDGQCIRIDVSELTPENREKVLDYAAFLLSRQQDL